MPKPKLSDFKKLLAEMTEEELRTELLKLFNKLEQVQMFYAQDLLSKEDRLKFLEEAKRKIYAEYWTRTGNPRIVNNAKVKSIQSDFEKTSAFPNEVIELLLYRVEVVTKMADEFGGASDADYNASSTAFKKAVQLMQKHKLEDYFKEWCIEIIRGYDNLDHWYLQDLKDLYEEYIGKIE
jgi:Family of unknown function (DUF6155)